MMRALLKQVGWLLAVGAVPPLLLMLMSRRWDWDDVWQAFWTSAMFSTLIGLPAGFVLPRLVVRARGLSSRARMTLFAGALFGMATVGTMAGVGLMVLSGHAAPEDFWRWMRSSYKWSLFLTFCTGVLTYGYHHLQEKIEESNRKLRAKEFEEQQARRVATEARLASLESRIHPHFLFNALNSVTALIREDPVAAEGLLERVSALLRFSLYEPHGGLVSLERELQAVRDYLEIERVRFGARLDYEVHCAPGLGEVLVPPLAVQGLAENSVKYAITNRREGGRVRVEARREGGEVWIEVLDTGEGFSEAAIPGGHGLELLAARLEAHFGGAAGIDYARGEHGMTVRVRVPLAVTV